MKALIVGSGKIGSVAAEDMAKNNSSVEVTVADKDEKRAKIATERIGRANVSSLNLDTSNCAKLVTTLREFDLVMGFLPGNLGYALMEACIEANRNMVDVSFMGENPLTLGKKAVEADVTVVPDCGLAPGISNVLVGHATKKLAKVKSVHIMVGGLPDRPVPPLGYVITWSPESLIDEYTRKVRVVTHGKTVEVKALGGLEQVDFPDVGRLEAFYTDGLRTLLETIGDVDEMWEKTLRYPGHAEKVEVLSALGFFDEEPVEVEGASVSPRKLAARILARKLVNPRIRDLVALKVEVSGIENGMSTTYSYHLLDCYDTKHGITAMARTTAFPASIIAQLVLKNAVAAKGVVAPEKLGQEDNVYGDFMKEMSKRGIMITEERVVG
jgi:saccharopine dehydrogenase-like NADP-dependent oxidoreductase